MTMLDDISVKQRDMIVHASGLSQSKDLYRNHYCDEPTNPDLLKLVELGLMKGPYTRSAIFGENAFFYLTEAGKDAARYYTGKLKARDTSR